MADRDTEGAMSQQNVEVVRRYFEGTGGPLEGESRWSDVKDYYPALAAEFWESDGDYYPVRKFPEARPCHGRDEIVALLVEIRSAWEGYRFEVKDAIAISDDRVLIRGHMWTEGRASGLALEGDIYHCCWLRHGRFIRVEDHLTARVALRALGLSGETLDAAGLREQSGSEPR
jgi:SnoaL-like domain